ncbi:MAG: hypothetical protein ACE5EQ_08685 [Phycisphaerae bacterium]
MNEHRFRDLGLLLVMFPFMLLIIGGLGPGCSQSEDSYENSPRMYSSKEFDSGRSDGRREAKASWTDERADWLWLWMTDPQYQQGFKQGWKEGRAGLKLDRQTSE